MMPLSFAEVGRAQIIRRISGTPEVKKHLEDLGFHVGGEISVVNTIGGNLIVNVKECRVAVSRELGCRIVEISALKGTGVQEAAEAAIEAAKNGRTVPMHRFSGPVEHALAHIEEHAVANMPEEQQRWYAVKLFERDEKAVAQMNLSEAVKKGCRGPHRRGREGARRRRGIHHHKRAVRLHRRDNQVLLSKKVRWQAHHLR